MNVSGIAELEQRMLQEIRRVKGFNVMADLCAYIIDKFRPCGDALAGLCSISGDEKMDNYYDLLEENGKFCTLLEGKIDDKCATMPTSIRNCFGHLAGQKPREEVQEAIMGVYEKYDRDLVDVYRMNLEIHLAGIARRINKIIDIDAVGAPHTMGAMDEGRYEDMSQRHNSAMTESKTPPDAELAKEPDIWNILLREGRPILDMLPLPKLPRLPGPMGGPVVAVPEIVVIIKKIYDLIFGESEEEKKNRQLEAAIRAEREAAERRARKMARFEEELKQYCQDLAMEFRNEARRNFRQCLSGLMEPLFQQIREELKKQTQIGEQVLSDVNRLGEILSSFEIIRADLKMSAI